MILASHSKKAFNRGTIFVGSVAALLLFAGCFRLSLDDAKKLAEVASWTGDNRVSIREKSNDDLWQKAKIVFGYGPEPSEQAKLYLTRYDVEPNFRRTKLESLKQLKIGFPR